MNCLEQIFLGAKQISLFLSEGTRRVGSASFEEQLVVVGAIREHGVAHLVDHRPKVRKPTDSSLYTLSAASHAHNLAVHRRGVS